MAVVNAADITAVVLPTLLSWRGSGDGMLADTYTSDDEALRTLTLAYTAALTAARTAATALRDARVAAGDNEVVTPE